MKKSSLILSALILTACPVHAALQFNFSSTGNAQADAGFAAAGARFSALFSDNITVNIVTQFTALGAGILGSASSVSDFWYYSDVRSVLIADKTSSNDFTATTNLQPTNLRIEINRTANSPHGTGSAIPYLDANDGLNNQVIHLSNANAKALGLLAGNAVATDANISFSSSFMWDFNPNDGITSGAFDFVGVATHEIGHALGFTSGVDILDQNSSGPYYTDDQFIYVTTLDLYRYSAQSIADTAIDWTADTRTKSFSIDGGATSLATFSTGVQYGDGNQASHWKDNMGIGIMDPTAAPGELLAISMIDILAFDVIGYDLVAVPEPVTFGFLSGVALLGVASTTRFRRKHAGKV